MCTYLLTTLKKTASTTFSNLAVRKKSLVSLTVRKNMKKNVNKPELSTFINFFDINFTSDPNKMTGNQILLQLFVP